MRVTVTVVGKPRNASLAGAIAEYEARAARYWPLEVREVREERGKGLSSDEVRSRESRRLQESAPRPGPVLCDVGGRSLDSEQFAKWLNDERDAGRDVSFVIGGAFGVSPELRKHASMRLALATWTLPHELARLVLVEQLYRAGTIVRGEPYHK